MSGFIVLGLVLAIPFAALGWWLVVFPREHGGLSFFAYRDLAKNGAPAPAKLVSHRVVAERMAGSRRFRYMIRVTEYLLDVTRADETTFRTSVTLPVPMSVHDKIAKAQPLPVRVEGDRVVIDEAALDAAWAAREAEKKAAEDRAFEEKRNAPPGT